MTAPVLSPVRWWRDDATRYQSRPPYKAQPEMFTFARPAPMTSETLQYLDDIRRWHDAYQAANQAARRGEPGPRFQTEAIVPSEFVRLDPVRYSPEQEAEIKRQIDEAFARGDFKQPEPVMWIGTLDGQSLEESI